MLNRIKVTYKTKLGMERKIYFDRKPTMHDFIAEEKRKGSTDFNFETVKPDCKKKQYGQFIQNKKI